MSDTAVAVPVTAPASAPTAAGEIPRVAFDDMALRVGDRMQLTLAARGGEPCMVRLIGYVREQSLLVSAPPVWPVPLIEGDTVVVRAFSGRSAFGFVSQVDKVIRLPFEYLHLSFPRVVAGRVIRSSRRVKTDIPVKLAGGEVASGTISNLSSTGAEIATDAAPGEAGMTLQLSFGVKVHDIDTPIALKAVIRSTRRTAGNGTAEWRSGLEFADASADVVAALKSLIYQELIERPQSVM